MIVPRKVNLMQGFLYVHSPLQGTLNPSQCISCKVVNLRAGEKELQFPWLPTQ